MTLSIIVAHDRAGGIGKENALPWHLPADLKHFKETTYGHPILMGRKTFEAIGRPLPGRKNLVLSRRPTQNLPESVAQFTSLEAALAYTEQAHTKELFIIGGGEIYRLALPLADRIYLTLVDTQSDADTFFPPVDPLEWRTVARWEHPADEKNQYPCAFLTMERVR